LGRDYTATQSNIKRRQTAPYQPLSLSVVSITGSDLLGPSSCQRRERESIHNNAKGESRQVRKRKLTSLKSFGV